MCLNMLHTDISWETQTGVVCECVRDMYAFLTIWDGGGHWLVIVGVAIGNSPHGVASIVMGTDKQFPRAFPHQALQLLRGGGFAQITA